MKNPFEIKLKVEEDPGLWERFVQWLNGDKSNGVGQQLPKIGTHTEILLSHTQKLKLKEAFDSPGERTSETTMIRRSDSGQDGLII